MAYKNLKTKEKNSRGDSQKWSVAYRSGRLRKLFIIGLKKVTEQIYLKRGLTMLVLRRASRLR